MFFASSASPEVCVCLVRVFCSQHFDQARCHSNMGNESHGPPFGNQSDWAGSRAEQSPEMSAYVPGWSSPQEMVAFLLLSRSNHLRKRTLANIRFETNPENRDNQGSVCLFNWEAMRFL